MNEEHAEILNKIRTHPGCASNGKPFDHVVKRKVATGEYKLQCIPAEVLGTQRPIEVYRAKRACGGILKPWQATTDDDTHPVLLHSRYLRPRRRARAFASVSGAAGSRRHGPE